MNTTTPKTIKNGVDTFAQPWRLGLPVEPQSGSPKLFKMGGLQNPYQNLVADGPHIPF